MGKLAFIFPGQASQYVGMGKDWYQNQPFAKEMFQKADDIVGYELSKICFEGPEEALKQTRVTQPAIFVHSLVAATWLREQGVQPYITAGHSLGEYSALVAAGGGDFESVLSVVQTRGDLMQKAGEDHPGTMAAIIGLTFEEASDICREASSEGVVVPANVNSPGQVAISGSIDGVHRAMEIAKEKGAKRVQELVVSGAFHSPLMDSAQAGLSQALDLLELRDSQVPVVVNVTAEPESSGEGLKQSLKNQLTSPVLWEATIRRMVELGVDRVVEVGPGKVLQGLVRRIDPDITRLGCDTVEQASQVVDQLQ